jgi:hypothetical protein
MNGRRIILLHRVMNKFTSYSPHVRGARRAG